MKLIQTEDTLAVAAAKAGMDEKTARRYRDAGQLPSQLQAEHTWRTREDPFEEVWPGLKQMLDLDDGLEAKTLFEYLQRTAFTVRWHRDGDGLDVLRQQQHLLLPILRLDERCEVGLGLRVHGMKHEGQQMNEN